MVIVVGDRGRGEVICGATGETYSALFPVDNGVMVLEPIMSDKHLAFAEI